MKVMRFGDNMRNVAVTEGDKVEVQKKLGWEVNTWAVGDLVKKMNAVTEAEIDELMAVYREKYDFATDDIAAIRYQAREEIAMKKMMDAEGCKAFSNTFQDLYGMEQLPGLASQHLMAQGYGYGGEGDWKVAAMTAILKKPWAKTATARPRSWRTTPIISSRARSIPSARICWRSARPWQPAVRASRRTSSASA